MQHLRRSVPRARRVGAIRAAALAHQQQRAYAVGDNVLSAPDLVATDGSSVKPADYFKGRTVAVVAVVGAFTGTCNTQIPAFVEAAEQFKGKGVDEVACITVNDHIVTKAWADHMGAGSALTFLADPSAAYTKAVGKDLDLSAANLGVRSHRYTQIIKDGVVVVENQSANPGEVQNTGAADLLAQVSE